MDGSERTQLIYVDPSDPAYVRLVDDTAQAFRQASVTPLLGAGISFEEPSNLPMAPALVAPLANVLLSAARLMYAEVDATDKEIAELHDVLHNARLERLLDVLHTTHGNMALTYLYPLMGSGWNLNHAALGALAQHGYLRTGITLNFDLLIENAALAHGVTTTTTCPLVGKSFQTGTGMPRLHLVKPHGSFTPESPPQGPHDFLSATLSQAGSHPLPRNVDAVRTCINACPVLLVAGYSDNDWDIFPILPRISNSLRRVMWIDHRSDDDVRQRVPAWDVNVPFNSLRDRIVPWLQQIECESYLLLGRARQFLHDVLEVMFIDPEPCPNGQAISEPDAGMFLPTTTTDPLSMKTMLSFALLVQQRNKLSERLLVWCRDRATGAGLIQLEALAKDAIGHTQHTYGNIPEAIRCTRRVHLLWRKKGNSTKAADSQVWLGYEYLCLAKRPSPLRPIQLLSLPLNVLKGLYHLRKGVRAAEGEEHQRLHALAAFYRIDLLHSWGSLLLLLGPKAAHLCHIPFRAIERLYATIAKKNDLMQGQYYWLRHLEAQLLSGIEIDAAEANRVLEELERSYSLTQSNVQIGNVDAYRGLMAYLLGDGSNKQRRERARIHYQRAQKTWNQVALDVNAGMRRLILFRRLSGDLGFVQSIREFLWHA